MWYARVTCFWSRCWREVCREWASVHQYLQWYMNFASAETVGEYRRIYTLLDKGFWILQVRVMPFDFIIWAVDSCNVYQVWLPAYNKVYAKCKCTNADQPFANINGSLPLSPSIYWRMRNEGAGAEQPEMESNRSSNCRSDERIYQGQFI